MPKVSDEHRAARRDQILRAAWKLFAANGFHATSMSQIIRESGLSAGAVYLYFRSKEELIVATAERSFAIAVEAVEPLLHRDSPVAPGDALASLFRGVARLNAESGRLVFPVAIQAWGEATRNPAIADAAHGFFAGVLGRFAAIIRRWSDERVAVGTADSLARMGAGLLAGFVVQSVVLRSDPEPDYIDVVGERFTAMCEISRGRDRIDVAVGAAPDPPAEKQ